MLGCAGHVGAIDMQLSIRQLLPYSRPDVHTQPLHRISIRRMFPGPDCHEVCPAADGFSGLNTCEERSDAELVMGNAVDIPQERMLIWGADQCQV